MIPHPGARASVTHRNLGLAIICLFETIGVFQDANGILEIDAMQPAGGRGFDLVPFVTSERRLRKWQRPFYSGNHAIFVSRADLK